ncbi:MAG TPA: HAD family hydrolase [Gemmatimonadales bacterium]|nr:HAD family hydrolase [Gemmatimonadales bacterium]
MADSVLRRAVFLDRDGTIVDDPGFLADPAQVRLLPGAAGAIRHLNRAGLVVVVVSNQSGIARGLYGVPAYEAVQHRLTELLAAEDAHLDAAYYCPHLPEISGPCECRKPGILLYTRASDELGLDLARSWYVGDRLSDVEPARRLGGVGILVQTGLGNSHADQAAALGIAIVPDLAAAAAAIVDALKSPRSPA